MTNNQSMIDHIATVVMGWELSATGEYYTYGESPYEFGARGGRVKTTKANAIWVEDFNPFENHQQAFDALDTFVGYQIGKEKGAYWCTVDTDGDSPRYVTGNSADLLTAICTAICRATGYEG